MYVYICFAACHYRWWQGLGAAGTFSSCLKTHHAWLLPADPFLWKTFLFLLGSGQYPLISCKAIQKQRNEMGQKGTGRNLLTDVKCVALFHCYVVQSMIIDYAGRRPLLLGGYIFMAGWAVVFMVALSQQVTNFTSLFKGNGAGLRLLCDWGG